jgi:hypothetical protein
VPAAALTLALTGAEPRAASMAVAALVAGAVAVRLLPATATASSGPSTATASASAAAAESTGVAAVVALIDRELGNGTGWRLLAFDARQLRANQGSIRGPQRF